MTNKIHTMIASGVALIAIALMVAVSIPAFALADESSDNRGPGQAQTSVSIINSTAPQLRVEPNGRFSASGATVNTSSVTITNGVATGSLAIKLFGLNFTVQASGAKVDGLPATTTAPVILSGDVLSLTGTINPTSGMITVDRIVDQTLKTRQTGDIQARINELLRLIEQLRAQLRQMGR